MEYITELNRTRHLAGLKPLTEEALIEQMIAEKKLTGQAKQDFLDKMNGKKKTTKKEDEVDDGEPGPSKGAKKAIDKGTTGGDKAKAKK